MKSFEILLYKGFAGHERFSKSLPNLSLIPHESLIYGGGLCERWLRD